MFKLYSKGCEYTLRLLSELPAEGVCDWFLTGALCELANVPVASTRKMLQKMVYSGLLEATRGSGGGYRLSRNPREVSLLDIIVAVDGTDSLHPCIMGLAECGGATHCQVHDVWYTTRGHILDQLKQTTIMDLIIKKSNGRNKIQINGQSNLCR